MNWVKEQGGPLVVGAVFLGIVLGYIELRAPVMVGSEMDSRGLVSVETMETALKAIEDQKVTHKEDRDRMDGKIERIIDILLEE
jgi:hypothetical protein